MAKVKGMKKLNKVMKEVLAPFGIEKAVLNGDWAYYGDENKLTYSIVEGTLEDIWFNEFVKERFGYKVKNTFMITVLHELGHHFTLENVYENDCVYDFCMREKERIEKEMKKAKTKKEAKKIEFQYFNLPDEIMATEWAVNYARENKKELEEMWEKIKRALVEFYTKNIDKGD